MRVLYTLGYSCCWLGLWVVSPLVPKARRGLWGRVGLTGRLRRAATWKRAPIWFHVASSGELEQCLPILDAVKRQDPDQPIFLSHFSPTGKQALRLEKERRDKQGRPVPWDYADYSPFDFGPTVRACLDILKPSRYVVINREVWPRLLEECFRRQIRCYLFATYFAQNAQSWGRIYRRWLKRFTFVGTIQPDTTTFLRPLLAPCPVQTVGDPRVERVLARRDAQKRLPWADFFEGQNVLIFASIWKKDLDQLGPALRNLAARHPEWRVFLAPHEPRERFVGECLHRLRDLGLKARRWSHWLNEPDLDSHLVVDQVGQLAEMYSIASLVFVGGSFRARVHNVLEPAAYGRPILTGPYIKNSAEALFLWQQKMGLRRAETADELSRLLEDWLSDAPSREAASKQLQTFLTARQGAGEVYARHLLQ